jgi:multicomponent Na+:H+ antiporter subunit A
METIAAVMAGFAAAPAAPVLYRLNRTLTGWLVSLVPFALFVYFLSLVGRISAGETILIDYAWVPLLDVRLSLMIDGLGLLFALMITGIGTLVFVYAGSYMHGHPHLGRMYAFLLMFMASMVGLVLANNIISLFLFWELTSISSYLLIGFNHEEEGSRSSALRALLITFLGGQVMLVGLIMLGIVTGTMEISGMLAQGELVQEHRLYLPILLCILAGAFTKSAQFPFHFWLPSAMAAPTPVSAYLHSATMVKAGIYLMARMFPALGGTDAWFYIVSIAGAITMVLGAYLAFRQTDLKLVLAYSTVSILGMLTLLLGVGSTYAIEALVVTLIAHSLYKGSLFLVAGAVDHEAGTRDIRELSGLRKTMPFVAAVAILAGLSLAGLPPMAGFIGNELIYEAVTGQEELGLLLTASAVIAKLFLVAVAGLVVARPFLGGVSQTAAKAHEAPLRLWVPPAILATLGLIFGILPGLIDQDLLSPAATAVLAQPASIDLVLWHGIGLVLILSVATIIAGAIVYLVRHQVLPWTQRIAPIGRYGPEQWYEFGMWLMMAVATRQTRIFQNGYLRYYLMTILGTLIGLVGFTQVMRGGFIVDFAWDEIYIFELALAVIILVAAVAAVTSRSRLGAVAALGIIGYSVAMIFIIYGAPDLAMAQFLVETLTVILFVLVFYHLPQFANITSPRSRLRDAALALASGGVVTAMVLVSTSRQFHPPISTYFTEEVIAQQHSRNVVNIILTDFRALDSLGEITVLALAGIGVYALLKLRPHGAPKPPQLMTGTSVLRSLILQTATRMLLPVLMLFSVFLLVRGHNEPGGGFTGGLVAAAGFALYAIAFDTTSARRALRVSQHVLIGTGLSLGALAGVVPMVRGDSFLTSMHGYATLPGIGQIELSSILVFDIGIYLVVLGVTLMIILNLGEE